VMPYRGRLSSVFFVLARFSDESTSLTRALDTEVFGIVLNL